MGLLEYTDDKFERSIQNGIYKLSCLDSRRYLDFMKRALTEDDSFHGRNDELMLDMLSYTLFADNIAAEHKPEYAVDEIRKRPYLKDELVELFDWLYSHINFVDKPSNLPYECPLDVYCSYSRNQILKALRYEKQPSSMREGVTFIPETKTDVFLVTLNKKDGEFTPSTQYNDYALDEYLFHWQSQSTTSSTSKTAMRYRNHKELGSEVLLFVRENKKESDTGMAQSYTFLGRCSFVSSEGSSPMNIIWKLEHPIPAKMIQKVNRMIIG